MWWDGPRRKSKTFGTEKEAKAWEAKITLAKTGGALDDLFAGQEPLKEFIDEWWERHGELFLAANTQKSYRDVIDRFILPTLGEQQLRRITPGSVVALREKVVRESGAATARKTLAVLQGVLERAVEWERIKVNPAKVVKKPSGSPRGTARALEPGAVEGLRRRLGGRDATLVSVLAYAGLRPGEALGLRWEDVGDRTLRVERAIALGEEKGTKTGANRSVRLLAPLKRDLQAYKIASGLREGLIFPRKDGKPWTDFDYRNWRKRHWKPVAPEGVRPYDLRHSFASLLLQEGMNPAEIAEQMGHSVQTLFSTYAHVIEELRGSERRSAEDLIRAARADIPQTSPKRVAEGPKP